MKRTQEKEKRRVFKELGGIIKEIGSKHDLTLIMEKRAGGVLYIAESADLTEEVIAAYDETKKGGK